VTSLGFVNLDDFPRVVNDLLPENLASLTVNTKDGVSSGGSDDNLLKTSLSIEIGIYSHKFFDVLNVEILEFSNKGIGPSGELGGLSSQSSDEIGRKISQTILMFIQMLEIRVEFLGFQALVFKELDFLDFRKGIFTSPVDLTISNREKLEIFSLDHKSIISSNSISKDLGNLSNVEINNAIKQKSSRRLAAQIYTFNLESACSELFSNDQILGTISIFRARNSGGFSGQINSGELFEGFTTNGQNLGFFGALNNEKAALSKIRGSGASKRDIMTKFLAISEDSDLGFFSDDNVVSVDGDFSGRSAVAFFRGLGSGILEVDGRDTNFLVIFGNANNGTVLARSQIIKFSTIQF